MNEQGLITAVAKEEIQLGDELNITFVAHQHAEKGDVFVAQVVAESTNETYAPAEFEEVQEE